eukprot:2138503-Prymnesium_polylepis.1
MQTAQATIRIDGSTGCTTRRVCCMQGAGRLSGGAVGFGGVVNHGCGRLSVAIWDARGGYRWHGDTFIRTVGGGLGRRPACE